jgi:site-specific DNA recombinase
MELAAIYARVSSSRQKEEQTIASQLAALRAYGTAEGWEVPPDWVFADDGYSGATLVRPALERLRDLIAAGQITVVLCYAPDRLSRRYAYQVVLLEEFARAGAQVRFVRGRAGSSPEEELLLQFQGMIAEYEKAQITERTRRGKLYRARAGAVSVLSAAPYGYRYVRQQEGVPARYEIVEPEAAVVREVFRLFVEAGRSLGAVARELSARGIVTARGKHRWTGEAVRNLLRNPAYCGRAAYGKTQRTHAAPVRRRPRHRTGAGHPCGKRQRPRAEWIEIGVPAIVEERQYEQVAQRLEANQQFAARRTLTPTLLQGLVVCGSCGFHMGRTSRNRRRMFYRCPGNDNYRFEHGRVCSNPAVPQEHLDGLVWEEVTGLLAQPERLHEELERRLRDVRSGDSGSAQHTRLDDEQTRIERTIRRMLQAYQDELLTLDELRERLPAVRHRQSAVRAQLAELEAQAVDQAVYLQLADTVDGFLARLRATAEQSSVPERQRVVRLLVHEILVTPERILIRHSIPTSTPTPPHGGLLRQERQVRLRGLPSPAHAGGPFDGLRTGFASLVAAVSTAGGIDSSRPLGDKT